MIDYDDLINRIEGMHDLPVSEEMLGAYCEDSLNLVDAAEIDSFITNDAELSELVDNVDNLQVFDETCFISFNNVMIDDIDLPEVQSKSKHLPHIGGIIANIAGNLGNVAAIASPLVFWGMDNFILNDDGGFTSDNSSIDTEDKINNDDPLDNSNLNK